MAGLGAFAQVSVLQLNEVTHMGACIQNTARTQAGEWTGIAALTQDRTVDMAVGLDHHTLAQGTVLDHAVRADLDVIFNDHATFEDHVDIDQHVTAYGDFTAYVKTCRIAQGDAQCHQTARFAELVVTLELGQLPAIVGALHFHRVQRLLGGDHQAIGHSHGDDVGQVVLALSVVVGQTAQPFGQARARNSEDAGVAFLDGFLRVAGVFVLDDCCNLTLGVAHDAAIAGGIIQGDGEQAQLLLGDLGQQALQGLDFDQRDVAVENQHGVSGQCRQCLGNCVTGTQLFVLEHEIQIIRSKALAHLFSAVANHHMNPLWLELAGAVDNMAEHGVARNRVQNLGQCGAHASALACGKNNDIKRHLLATNPGWSAM